MTEYKPHCWVIIKMTNKDAVFYKILVGWTDDNDWRLSTIDKVEFDNDLYRFYDKNNSVYVVKLDDYGLYLSINPIWNTMKERYPDNVELLNNCDWIAFNFKGV